MSELKTRTITGIWIVIFILGGLWLHPYSFMLIAFVMLLGSQYEYYKLVGASRIKPQIITGIIAGVLIYITACLVASGLFPSRSFLIIIPVFIIICSIELYRQKEDPFGNLSHTFFGILYTVLPYSLFPFMAFGRGGLLPLIPYEAGMFSPAIIVGFFILLWTFDTGAYIIGVSIGRNRLFKRISPKKSWEGFFGGMVISGIIAWLLSGWLGSIDRLDWIIISILISVSGTYGDLIESMLKRSLEIKDSGTILPGHGGFLDRFDGVLISFPLVYIYIALFA